MSYGKVIIVCAPSGAGKSTIVKYLLKTFRSLSFSVSVTTREIRSNEVNGKDYYFLTKEKFKKLINQEKLIEWQEVYYGDFKGTLKSEVESLILKKRNIIFDVDVQGGISLKKYFSNLGLSIFIDVSDINILKERLEIRGTDSSKAIKERIFKAREEIKLKNNFDCIVLNDDLNNALNKLKITVNNFLNI